MNPIHGRATGSFGYWYRMMSRLPLLVSVVLFAACQSVPVPSAAPMTPSAAGVAPTAAAPGTADSGQSAADKLRQQQKDLRTKQRDLEQAKRELEVADIDRRERTMVVEAALTRTAGERDRATAELQVFVDDERPRELERHRLDVDQSTYHAEHQKDELDELVAMYEADEFAKSTKELVLKRGRRDLEMAERRLGIAKKELAHLEQFKLPQREKELRQKLLDTELERQKAELAAAKAKIELELARRKLELRMADLEEDIAELQKKIAKAEEAADAAVAGSQ